MRTFRLILCALVLAGCSRSGGGSSALPASLPATKVASASAGSTLLYSFKGGADGESPYAGLIALRGTLYGTTRGGGAGGDGTIFATSPAGSERIVTSFRCCGPVGEYPQAGVIAVNGKLYGTTYGQSPLVCDTLVNSCGGVYESSVSGVQRALHSFAGYPDGGIPEAGLVFVNGKFYGTTFYGGTSDSGSVFEVGPHGKKRIVYSFKGGADGENPAAGLIVANGYFYGTTTRGGGAGKSCTDGLGCGTVFALSASGSERVLYRFTGRSGDGAYPQAGLLVLDGSLYGTTSGGGASGKGTVFKVGLSGTGSALYSFNGGVDGASPEAGLVLANGTLYGTTFAGGAKGYGTVYAVSTSGKERQLYTFQGQPDGANPRAGLLLFNGMLYGTTSAGGASNDGTIFKVAP